MPQLPLAVSVELVHALVQTVAVKAGVRVLFIKGPTLAAQGIRAPRVSADVDVLVEPARFDELVEALRALAWHERVTVDAPPLLRHSTTLVHDRWGCDIDAHRFFPGVFTPPTKAFEFLWARRSTAFFAGTETAAPDPVAHACIAALHALRRPKEQRNMTELPGVVNALRGSDREDLAAVIVGLRTRTTMLPVLKALGIETAPSDLSPDEERAWLLTTSSPTRTARWIQRIQAAPWSQKPREFWHAVWLTERDLRIQWPDLPPGRLVIIRARVRRIGNGLRSLPPVIGAFARGRRRRSEPSV